jgi:ArsR family transcriptional regulator
MAAVKLQVVPGTEVAPALVTAGTHAQIAKLAKALAHPARVQIVETLLRRTTCIGCDIVEEIGLAASTTSEHLRILKEAGLIIGEIAHPRICYSLDPRAVAPLATFLQVIEAGPPPALPE